MADEHPRTEEQQVCGLRCRLCLVDLDNKDTLAEHGLVFKCGKPTEALFWPGSGGGSA